MGEESYYIDRISEYIAQTVLNENEKEFNQTILYGADTDIATIINAAKRYPMMSKYQVVIVKEAQGVKNIDELSYYLERIVVYANERSHQDTAVSKYQAYVSKAETLTVQASGALAFASPEILQIDDKRLESFYSESNELMHYKRAIDEIMRQKAHTLSAS